MSFKILKAEWIYDKTAVIIGWNVWFYEFYFLDMSKTARHTGLSSLEEQTNSKKDNLIQTEIVKTVSSCLFIRFSSFFMYFSTTIIAREDHNKCC